MHGVQVISSTAYNFVNQLHSTVNLRIKRSIACTLNVDVVIGATLDTFVALCNKYRTRGGHSGKLAKPSEKKKMWVNHILVLSAPG